MFVIVIGRSGCLFCFFGAGGFGWNRFVGLAV
jgi:hypothetical protein